MKNCTGIFCPVQYGKVDPATCQAADYCPQATPPKTNADRIREWSDEEIAEFTIGVMDGAFKSFTGAKMPDEKRRAMKTKWLEWLKQEANP